MIVYKEKETKGVSIVKNTKPEETPFLTSGLSFLVIHRVNCNFTLPNSSLHFA